MRLFDQIKHRLFKRKSRFIVGESVQLLGGEHLMVVTEIFLSKKGKEPLIHCKWYEAETNVSRTNLFPEKNLEPFNWYKKE